MVYQLLAPIVAALISCGLSYALGWRWPSPARLSIAALIGFWCSDMVLYQRIWPGFPPSDPAMWWIFCLPVLAGFALMNTRDDPGKFSLLVGGGMSLAYVYLLTEPLRQYAWADGFASARVIAWGFALGLVPTLVSFLFSSRVSPQALRHWPWLLFWISGGSAVLFLMGSSAVYAQAALVLCAIQGFQLFFRLSAGLVWTQTWLLAMLWLNVLLFASLSSVGLLAWSGFMATLTLRIPAVAALSLRWQVLTLGLVTGVCLGVAMVWVWSLQPHAAFYL